MPGSTCTWGSRCCSGSSPALSPGSILGPCAVRAFGFQSILASAGFSPGSPVFLLHLKLGFLYKSVSGIIWSYSASADWQLIMALRLESLGRYVARYKNQNLFILRTANVSSDLGANELGGFDIALVITRHTNCVVVHLVRIRCPCSTKLLLIWYYWTLVLNDKSHFKKFNFYWIFSIFNLKLTFMWILVCLCSNFEEHFLICCYNIIPIWQKDWKAARFHTYGNRKVWHFLDTVFIRNIPLK